MALYAASLTTAKASAVKLSSGSPSLSLFRNNAVLSLRALSLSAAIASSRARILSAVF